MGLIATNQIKWHSHGNEYQQCDYHYKNTVIQERVCFPFSAFKKTRAFYTVDFLVGPEHKNLITECGGTPIDSDVYYCEPGNYAARFNKIESAIKFIDFCKSIQKIQQ